MTDMPEGKREPSLLQQVEGAEKLFLSGRRNREADLESAVRFFLEFLHGFETLEFDRPCVTVFGSARFPETHRYYGLAREVGGALARAGFGVMTGGGGGMIEAALAAGLDTLVTGEGAHHTYFDAEEGGINVLFGGHYATEVFGVRALAEHVASAFGLSWEFLELPTGT